MKSKYVSHKNISHVIAEVEWTEPPDKSIRDCERIMERIVQDGLDGFDLGECDFVITQTARL